MSNVKQRVARLEERAVGDRVIVVRRGDELTRNGEPITEAELQELQETCEVVLLKVVREGDDEPGKAD